MEAEIASQYPLDSILHPATAAPVLSNFYIAILNMKFGGRTFTAKKKISWNHPSSTLASYRGKKKKTNSEM